MDELLATELLLKLLALTELLEARELLFTELLDELFTELLVFAELLCGAALLVTTGVLLLDSTLLFDEATLDKFATALDTGVELAIELRLELISTALASEDLSALEVELLWVSVAAARLLRALEIMELLLPEPPPQAVKVSRSVVERVLLTKYFASCIEISR